MQFSRGGAENAEMVCIFVKTASFYLYFSALLREYIYIMANLGCADNKS